MAARTPKAGDTYRLSTDEPFGNGPDAIQPGTVVTVREVVTADTPGAHNDTEDAVVVETPTHSVGYDEDGNPQILESTRAYSVGLEQFANDYTKEG